MSAPTSSSPGFFQNPYKWTTRALAKRMPDREGMASNKYLAPIAHRFLSPELWRFTRRSVPRGIALGLFSAFVIPVGQIFVAAFLALPARANVPLSALATFITNPFTLPFWLVVANRVGAFMLRIDAATALELDLTLVAVGEVGVIVPAQHEDVAGIAGDVDLRGDAEL